MEMVYVCPKIHLGSHHSATPSGNRSNSGVARAVFHDGRPFNNESWPGYTTVDCPPNIIPARLSFLLLEGEPDTAIWSLYIIANVHRYPHTSRLPGYTTCIRNSAFSGYTNVDGDPCSIKFRNMFERIPWRIDEEKAERKDSTMSREVFQRATIDYTYEESLQFKGTIGSRPFQPDPSTHLPSDRIRQTVPGGRW